MLRGWVASIVDAEPLLDLGSSTICVSCEAVAVVT